MSDHSCMVYAYQGVQWGKKMSQNVIQKNLNTFRHTQKQSAIHSIHKTISRICLSSVEPTYTKDIEALEGVQKFALRACCKKWPTSSDTLLDLPSLQPRRRYLKLCLLFEPIYKLVDFPQCQYNNRSVHNLQAALKYKHAISFLPSIPLSFRVLHSLILHIQLSVSICSNHYFQLCSQYKVIHLVSAKCYYVYPGMLYVKVLN